MLTRNSRYKDSPLFSLDADGNEVFAGLRARRIGAATPVIEHPIAASDRLDHLSSHYYNNDRRWWRLIDANPDILYADTALGDEATGLALSVPRVKE